MISLNNTIYRDVHADGGERGPIPLVLIHAFPVDHRMWDDCAAQIAELSEQDGLAPFPIWAPDMPGAGTGPIPVIESIGHVAPDGAYSEALDRLADAHVELLRQRGYAKAIWVGLSMGGYVALDIQRLHPDAVAGIALCDTKATADSAAARLSRLHIAATCEGERTVEPVMHFARPQSTDSTIKRSPEFVAKFTDWIHQQTPEGIAWRERMAAGRPDLSDQLAKISAPAALISGENDPSSPPAHMKPMAAAIVNAPVTFTPIPNCGHFSAVEHPDTVARTIVDLVARVQGA